MKITILIAILTAGISVHNNPAVACDKPVKRRSSRRRTDPEGEKSVVEKVLLYKVRAAHS